MINQPDQDTQGWREPSGRLILPAPAGEDYYSQPYTTPVRPEQRPIRQPAARAASGGLSTRLTTLWRKDPAYRILSLAIVLVVVASLIFVAMGASALLGNNNNGPTWSSAYIEHPTVPAPTGTVDNQPTFATPTSNQGTNQSSQPPAVPSPRLQPTTDTGDNQNGGGGNLQVQIVNIPNVVANNTRVHVDVQTSEPNVTVRLQVTYNTAPFIYSSSSARTDDNGNATLSWSVKVVFLANQSAQAQVMVSAIDQNGQSANSQAVTVMIQ